jgi:hypothetical protein
MSNAPLPNWQPISMLPKIAEIIDGELADAEEHHTTLLQVRDRPHVLDDATVQRSIKLHTEQLEFLWVFQEQLDRWRQAGLKPHKREEIDHLSVQLGRLHTVLTDILALADELRQGTIDKVLAKSDLELGIDVLLRGIKRH